MRGATPSPPGEGVEAHRRPQYRQHHHFGQSQVGIYQLGQVKFPNLFNTAPQILQMVDLVRVNAKKIDLKASNQLQFGLLRFMGNKITVETKRFDQP